MIKVKILMTLEVDPDEYAVPADGNVEEDFTTYMQELIHDVEGVKIKKLGITAENTYD